MEIHIINFVACHPGCLHRSTCWEGSGKISVCSSYSIIFCPIFFPPPLLLGALFTVSKLSSDLFDTNIPTAGFHTSALWEPAYPPDGSVLCHPSMLCSGFALGHWHFSFSSRCHYTAQILILGNQISPQRNINNNPKSHFFLQVFWNCHWLQAVNQTTFYPRLLLSVKYQNSSGGILISNVVTHFFNSFIVLPGEN